MNSNLEKRITLYSSSFSSEEGKDKDKNLSIIKKKRDFRRMVISSSLIANQAIAHAMATSFAEVKMMKK